MVVAQPNYYNDFHEVKRLRDILSRSPQTDFPSKLPVLVIERKIHGASWISLTFLYNFGLFLKKLKASETILSVFGESIHRQNILADKGVPCSSNKGLVVVFLDTSQATWIQSWRMACTEDRVQRFPKYRGRQYSPDWKLQVGESSSSKYDLRKISFEFLDGHIWKILCKCHLDDCRSLKTVVQEDYFVGRKNRKAR